MAESHNAPTPRRSQTITLCQGMPFGTRYPSGSEQDQQIAAANCGISKERYNIDHGFHKDQTQRSTESQPSVNRMTEFWEAQHSASATDPRTIGAGLWKTGQQRLKLIQCVMSEARTRLRDTLCADLGMIDINDGSLLDYAGKADLTAVMRFIEAEANVNVQDKYGATALISASEEGCGEIVDALLAAGAKMDLYDDHKRTAVIAATCNGETEIVKALASAGASLDLQDKDGCTALMVACEEGESHIATALLNAGADPNIPDKWGNTPLMTAMNRYECTIVTSLIEAGADLELENDCGGTAMAAAVAHGHTDIAAELELCRSRAAKSNVALKADATETTKCTQSGGMGNLHKVDAAINIRPPVPSCRLAAVAC